MKMKIKDPEKLKKARNIINLLLEGINPITYDAIVDESFLNDPAMIRIFSYIGLVLQQDILEAEGDEKEFDSSAVIKSLTKKPMNGDYKSINDKIKSKKYQTSSKTSLSELKKLAEYMKKEENQFRA